MESANADQQPISNLGAMAGSGQPQTTQSDDGSIANQTQAAPAAPAPQPKSRLLAIIQAVANVGSTAMAGIPDTGRPGFVQGLGQGARAQQAIKFRDFDSQVRIAQLHNQDLKLQNDTQAQTDAHIKAELDMRKMAADMGVDYDTIANHGPAVMDHLTAQTAANGAASVPAGTHISADGNNIYIPQDTQKTREGQLKMYNELRPALGLPALPEGAQFVPSKNVDFLTNLTQGYGLDGKPIKHDDLPGMIGAAKAQRDQLAKSGGTQNQLKALDNRIGLLQTNLDTLDKHAAGVKQQSKAAELAAETSPENIAGQAKLAGAKAKAEYPYKAELQNNAAKNKNDSTELNAVAYDPNYQNSDGTKGANVVMSKADAQAKGLTHYKADASTINTVVAGMNDVQNKLNQLADVVTDPKRMGQVQPEVAAAMLKHGHGISLEFKGLGLDTSTVNETLYGLDVKAANQATRDYVTAMVGAHEAVTQLPRLQTFGKSNRMTEKQMEAAQNLLPHPGDGTMAGQKMVSLQGMLDPLRKQIPHMPGAESIPSFLEKQRQQIPSGGSNLGRAVVQNPNDIINRLVPSN